MITIEESEKLQRGLGADFGNAVQKIVESQGHRTKTGTLYTRNHISMVLRGQREVLPVEEALREVYTKNVTQIFKDVKDLGIEISVE